MALNAEALITVALATEMLGLTEDDSSILEKYINQASAIAEQRTRRKLKSRTYTSQTFDGMGSRKILFPEYPLSSVSAISVDGVNVLSLVKVYRYGEIRLTEGVFTEGDQNVVISAVAGYDPVPDDLQDAVLEIVAWNMKRFVGKGIGIRSESADGVNIGMEIEIPMNAARILFDHERKE